MSLKLLDVVFAAVLAFLGGFIVWEALDYGYFVRRVPGPGFFPLWVGGLLMAVSLVNLGRMAAGVRLSGAIEAREIVQAACLVVLLLGFAVVAPHVGMVPAAMLMALLGGAVIRWRDFTAGFVAKLVIMAVGVPLLCLFIFGRVLRVPLF